MLGEHLDFSQPVPGGTQPFFVGPTDSPAESATSTNSAENRRTAAKSRVIQNFRVTLRPSSSSQRGRERIHGLCKNVSQSGCGLNSDFAPRVGDFYRIEVEDTTHFLHGVHARCVRCHLLDEDLFEAGFSFLSRVKLPKDNLLDGSQKTSASNSLAPLSGA